MSVTVRIDQGALARILRARGGLARRSLERRTERVADVARATAPGRSARYISTTYTEDGRGIQGHVVFSHPKARVIVHPTRPHIIRARRARALRFRSRATGDIVFRKMVRHPGTKGNDFLVRALQAARR